MVRWECCQKRKPWTNARKRGVEREVDRKEQSESGVATKVLLSSLRADSRAHNLLKPSRDRPQLMEETTKIRVYT